ncbi:hypothetical protein EYZ11_012505 [Aspergillus tanneri]|uniref:Uncharacterized protein n=1 Tax=Aspergillus tanneri TaxID=1220188 RepID=A0A4S3J5G8_9EURO|nr:hypothetical protein EYZ11_012505 [Aspergillus tanneri]
MPWLLPAEIFPLRGRRKGKALATPSNWVFNFIIVHFCHVETSNHTLEEIAVAFGDKAFDNDEDVMEAADAKNES